jgi:DegV family protein with EDD domain
MKIAFVTDSTCDLPPELTAERGIEVTPLHVLWGTESYSDGVDIDNETFYKRLAHDSVLPKTSQPAPGEYAEKYRQAIEKQRADVVVCLPISSRLSGSFAAAQAASALVDFPVRVVDSRTGSMALGLVLLAAADARDGGASLDEVVQAAERASARSQMLFLPNTLEFLHRGGRIGNAQRFIGTALSIKPILYVKDGFIEALENVRTRKRAMARLVEITAEYKEKRPLWIGIAHTGAPELDEFRAELQAATRPDLLLQTMTTTSIGVHIGPGAIGIGLVHG